MHRAGHMLIKLATKLWLLHLYSDLLHCWLTGYMMAFCEVSRCISTLQHAMSVNKLAMQARL